VTTTRAVLLALYLLVLCGAGFALWFTVAMARRGYGWGAAVVTALQTAAYMAWIAVVVIYGPGAATPGWAYSLLTLILGLGIGFALSLLRVGGTGRSVTTDN
jgi:hypothetical protein